MGKKLPKTMGASTHTFKIHGFYITHSTHTNKDPDYNYLRLHIKMIDNINSWWSKKYQKT